MPFTTTATCRWFLLFTDLALFTSSSSIANIFGVTDGLADVFLFPHLVRERFVKLVWSELPIKRKKLLFMRWCLKDGRRKRFFFRDEGERKQRMQ